MKIYAITGGIGSGKSTIAKFLEKEGFPVISADLLNLEVAKRPEVQKQIFDRFGTNDRLELRKIIFADTQAKKDIEALMHPLVQELFFKRFEELSDKGFEVVFYESALVFELKQEDAFEGVICAWCDESTRIKRVLPRDHMSEEIAKNILSCQVNDDVRFVLSDYVIETDCSLERLEEKTKEVLRQILNHSSLPSQDKKD